MTCHDRPTNQLILASGSPRRRHLLESIGLTFEVLPADIDETEHPGEPARSYVERVAAEKAAAVADRLVADGRSEFAVLAADTTVDLDGSILAKPVDDVDAARMLLALAGRTHQVHTAVVGRTSSQTHTVTVTTDVTFIRFSEQEIEWYLSIGEHLDKAGAYGMQTAGGALVERIDGSPTNVIGLPLAETISLLQACGVEAARS